MSEEIKEELKEATAAAPEKEETMADYEAEIAASMKPIHEGDIMTGTVIGISETEITLDFGSSLTASSVLRTQATIRTSRSVMWKWGRPSPLQSSAEMMAEVISFSP